MSTIPEQLSTNFSNSSGKPDSNLSNDSNNLGGIPANEYATKENAADMYRILSDQ